MGATEAAMPEVTGPPTQSTGEVIKDEIMKDAGIIADAVGMPVEGVIAIVVGKYSCVFVELLDHDSVNLLQRFNLLQLMMDQLNFRNIF